MALTQRLDLRQSQSLVMTPQLQQAIKLLQLSNLELSAYVEQELERNPLLQAGEEADNDGDSATEKQQPDTGDSQLDGEGDGLGTLDLAAGDGIARREDAPLDTDYDNMWNGAGESGSGPPSPSAASESPGGARSGGTGDGDRNLEQTLSDQVSLRDHLLAQINADLGDPVERKIGIYLVDMLDDSGYLGTNLDEVALLLGCDRAILDNTVTKLLRLDPVGIFAHDLAQCLALQLEERNRLDPAMQALLDNLDLLAKRDLAALIARCGVDQEDLTEMVAEIRMLTPKPAQAFEKPSLWV